MALVKSQSKKCPVCMTRTKREVKVVNKALQPILDEVKERGEVPSKKDPRWLKIGSEFSIFPNSLRYHLKECLVDQEIQDQRLVELKALTEALETAKTEYAQNPNVNTATALTSIMTSWRQLAKDVEGQVDPEVTVEFLVENVIASINREVLSSLAGGIRDMRNALVEGLPAGQKQFVKSQADLLLDRIAQDLRAGTEEAMNTLCEYYRVDIETKQKKRSLEQAVPTEIPNKHEVN